MPAAVVADAYALVKIGVVAEDKRAQPPLLFAIPTTPKHEAALLISFENNFEISRPCEMSFKTNHKIPPNLDIRRWMLDDVSCHSAHTLSLCSLSF